MSKHKIQSPGIYLLDILIYLRLIIMMMIIIIIIIIIIKIIITKAI